MIAPDLRVLLDGDDVSSYIDEDLAFSSVDGGGFETASWSFPRRVSVRKGAPVHIGLGLATAWEGRVGEAGDTLAGSAKTAVGCEGYGARLKENLVAEIYVDRDPSRWQGPSAQRKLNLIASLGLNEPATQSDRSTGTPTVRTAISGPWATVSSTRQSEAWYDAQDIPLGSLYYAWRRGGNLDNANVNWTWAVRLLDDDVATAGDATVNLRAAGPGSGTLSATTASRTFANLYLAYADVANPAEGYEYALDWYDLAVYGRHGLTLRPLAGAPPGLYPSDIASHALVAAGANIDAGSIEVASGFVVPQAVYREAVAAERIIAEMAVLAGGYHWGTWDAGSVTGGRPRLDFRALPASPTAFCSRADCDDLQLTERLGDLYDRVLVSYEDGGSTATVERTRGIPELAEAGVGRRTLPLNMGIGTPASAEIFGDFALALSEKKARAAGTAQLSGVVGTLGGGRRHACLLRPGVDKLRVTDLPDLPFLAGDRHDFQLQRVECRANRQGVTTQLALGSGPDLMEVLQARLALGTDVALFGR